MKCLFLLTLCLLTLICACNTPSPTVPPPVALTETTVIVASPTNSVAFRPTPSATETAATFVVFPTPENGVGEPGVDNHLLCAVLSPDGKYIAVATWQGMFLYRADTFAQVWANWRDDLRSVDIVFLADSTRFVAAGMDKTLLWNINRAEPERIFAMPLTSDQWDGEVAGLAVTPDGHILATAAFSGLVYLWDVTNGEQLGAVPTGYGGSGGPLAFSPDGRLLAATGGQTIALWNVSDLTLAGKLPCPNSTQLCGAGAFVFSPDGKYLATSVSLIDIDARQVTHQWAFSIDSGLAFTPDGKMLWGVFMADIQDSSEFQLAAWDVATGQLANTFSVVPELSRLSFSADGKFLLTSASYGSVILWDVATKTPLHTLSGNAPEISRPVSSPTPEPDVSLTPLPPQPTPTSLPHQTLRFGQGQPRTAVIAQDGRLIVAGTQGVEIYQHQRRTKAWQWPAEMDLTAAPITLSPLGLAAAVSSSKVFIWQTDAAKPIQSWELPTDLEYEVAALAFSPDGKTLAAGGWDVAGQTGIAVIWEVQTGRVLLMRQVPVGWPVSALRFSPNGRQLALGAGQQTYLWHPDTDEIREVKGGCRGMTHNELTFSSDGQWLVDACNLLNPSFGFLTLWELTDSAVALFWDEGPFVYSVAFAPDDNTLAIGGQDFIYLMDFARTHELGFVVPSSQDRWLRGLTMPVVKLLFAADGRTLISILEDGTIDLWGIAASGAPVVATPGQSYTSAAAPSGCALAPGLAIHASTNARLWSAPDVNDAQTTWLPDIGQTLYVMSGPKSGHITEADTGWFWEVSRSAGGASAGWIWQSRIRECP